MLVSGGQLAILARPAAAGALGLALLWLAAGSATADFAWRSRPRLSAPGALDAQAVGRAETLLANPPAVPTGEAQWIFYYACPQDGARLRPETADQHRCPTCGAIYDDARTVAAHRHLLHDQLNRNILDLATAHHLSGDGRFAELATKLLLDLARLYPNWPRHDRWGRTGLLATTGGWRYAQLLDEAVSLIVLARAYDLIAEADCLDDDRRRRIEAGLFGHVARAIRRWQPFVDNRSNHQTWFNAAYATAGVAVADAELLRQALEGQFGLAWQLEHSVTDDGLWYEGTMAYHFYALQAVEQTLEAAQGAGVSLAEHARLRSLWEGPRRLAYPNGQLAAINDSDPANLAAFARHFAWAAEYFAMPFDATPSRDSALLADAGLAVLRVGTGADSAMAILDYGQHGGGHGHFDKLNLLLYADGREWLLDPGRLTYSVPEHHSWARTTVAHNTVAIDGRSQQATSGQLLHFATGDGWAATAAETEGAYPGILLRRCLLLTEGFLVDVFEVRSDRSAPIDWFAHAVAERLLPAGEAGAVALGEGDGYGHFRELRTLSAAGPWIFAAGDRRLAVWGVEAPGETVLAATGIGYRLEQRLPTLIRRRQAAKTTFATVYDWRGAVRAVRISQTGDTFEMEVATPDTYWRLRGTGKKITVEQDETTEQ